MKSAFDLWPTLPPNNSIDLCIGMDKLQHFLGPVYKFNGHMKHMQLKLQPSTINFYKNNFVILATATYVRVDESTVPQAWHCIYMSIVIREGYMHIQIMQDL